MISEKVRPCLPVRACHRQRRSLVRRPADGPARRRSAVHVADVKKSLKLNANQQTLWNQVEGRSRAILRERQRRREALQEQAKTLLARPDVELRDLNRASRRGKRGDGHGRQAVARAVAGSERCARR